MTRSDHLGRRLARWAWSMQRAYPGRPTATSYSGRLLAERFGRVWPWSWGTSGSFYRALLVLAAMLAHMAVNPRGRVVPMKYP